MNQSPMFKHAVESFEHGLEHYLDGSEKSRKFALLHIDQAIELFLKEKVVQIGKTIYKNDGNTLNLHEAFRSLKNLDIPERPRLEELHDLRNVIQHKGLTPDAGSTQFYVEVAYYFAKRFLNEELDTPLEQILTREYRALLEGQPLLFEKTDEVILAFENALDAETPTQKIISGFTALNRAVDILSNGKTGKVFFRRILRNAAKSFGGKSSDIRPYLGNVMRLRNQVVHSAYQPTDSDADDFLNAIRTILEMIGCEFETQ
jgi:hypothetical protein